MFAVAVLADLHEQLRGFTATSVGSVDPELMIRCCWWVTVTVSVRAPTVPEVALHLAYRWFCKLDLEDGFTSFDVLGESKRRFRERDLSYF